MLAGEEDSCGVVAKARIGARLNSRSTEMVRTWNEWTQTDRMDDWGSRMRHSFKESARRDKIPSVHQGIQDSASIVQNETP